MGMLDELLVQAGGQIDIAGLAGKAGLDPAMVHGALGQLLPKIADPGVDNAQAVADMAGKTGLDAGALGGLLPQLVPGVGDAAMAAMGLYLVWEARNLGASRFTLARMRGNVGVDALLGSVPLAGDVFDFFFRSNSRNLKLLRRQLNRAPA